MSKEFRFLLTRRCNYNCWFCHHEGLSQSVNEQILNCEDYTFLYKIGRDYFGFQTTTISGGEPLLHENIYSMCQAFYNIGAPVTITTNAYYLDRWHDIGRYIKSINISIHTLQPFLYRSIVGGQVDLLDVVRSIQTFAYHYPDVSICLNVTIMENINNNERNLAELVGFADKIHAKIKFIELFPSSTDGFASLDYMKRLLLKNQFVFSESLPRKQYFKRKNTTAYLTKTICASQEESEDINFCNKYNDIYVSPDGKMLTCRNLNNAIDACKAIKQRDIPCVKNLIEQTLSKIGQQCCLIKNR